MARPSTGPRLIAGIRDYAAALPEQRDLLLAAIFTGLRPFCELAKLTAADIEVTPRGMMWRVYSSKTQKTRKIPVRAEAARLTRRLLKLAPRDSGLRLFRTQRQRAREKCNGVVMFISLRKRLGWDPVSLFLNAANALDFHNQRVGE